MPGKELNLSSVGSIKLLERVTVMQVTGELSDLLTPREFEVMELVVAGMLNTQIAGELAMAEKTVKVHRGRVMQKGGCYFGT